MPEHTIYTVSQLTSNIKTLLETRFPIIWIEGEISNFRAPGSGHFYFTLKDSQARLSAVMFANQNRHLQFVPEDGMRITGLGRLSVYEPRGTYQIILEHMIPRGTGELLAAFEQLKKKLAAEGLFDKAHKKPLPYLPAQITLISSVTGAVIHDMIHVITRRFPGVFLEIIPSTVQGESAAEEIASAIALANEQARADVIVIARGGGSLEDLMPFNQENLARAIFQSEIPVVSAVGHETDFTICDFTADVRAPTPSAAAEIIVPVKQELLQQNHRLRERLDLACRKLLRDHGVQLQKLSGRLVDPRRKIVDARLRLDDYTQRLRRLFQRNLHDKNLRLHWQREKLFANLPHKITGDKQLRLDHNRKQLLHLMGALYINNTRRLHELKRRLDDLSPQAVLERGYSITRCLPKKTIVRSSDEVAPGDRLEIQVWRGKITGIVQTTGGEAP